MATIKSYTDIEQSRKLAEILPLDSADNYYSWHDERYYVVNKDCPYPYSLKEKIPSWSLAALLNVLPRSIEFKDDKYYLRFMKDYVEYANDEVSITGRCLHTTGNNNLVDASYEMILKLHEHKMLNKC